jgi:hypothetical protein
VSGHRRGPCSPARSSSVRFYLLLLVVVVVVTKRRGELGGWGGWGGKKRRGVSFSFFHVGVCVSVCVFPFWLTMPTSTPSHIHSNPYLPH